MNNLRWAWKYMKLEYLILIFFLITGKRIVPKILMALDFYMMVQKRKNPNQQINENDFDQFRKILAQPTSYLRQLLKLK